jgi:UDP-N-acetylmuramoylalanine--D-glutamate ligase
MIEVTAFASEKVAVLGLARSGLAAAHALKRGGAEVLAWDDAAERRATAIAAGLPVVALDETTVAGAKALVLSPGIPHTYPKPHPVAALARGAKVEIIGDIELLARTCPAARYVGVTGTNGKSTTTALIGHILAAAGHIVAVGGNLGTPALALPPLGGDGIYVLEMSSYQLELTESLTFDVAVLLNVTPDHLERHGGMEGYIAAKRRIFRGQEKPQTAVIGIDDDPSRDLVMDVAATGGQTIIMISAESRAMGGVYVENGWLIDDMSGDAFPMLDLRELERLPGKHNWQNVAAAYATCGAPILSRPAPSPGARRHHRRRALRQ